MFYLPQQNTLFVHIPRTAGTSYKRFLENYGTNEDFELFDDHSPVSTALNYLDNPDALTKITIVRNPYDREVSLWRWGKAGPLASSDMDFEYWCKWRYTGRPKDASNVLTYLDPVTVTSLWAMHKTPQIYYLVDENGNFRMDYVGCFEKIDDLINWSHKQWHEKHEYVKHVAYGNTLPKARVLNKGLMDWRTIYEQCSNFRDVLDIIYNFYRWDFESFGYNKDYSMDSQPTKLIGELPKLSSDPHNQLMSEFAFKHAHKNTGLLLTDSLSYRFMPEGQNRAVFLKNTSKFKINDVLVRG